MLPVHRRSKLIQVPVPIHGLLQRELPLFQYWLLVVVAAERMVLGFVALGRLAVEAEVAAR